MDFNHDGIGYFFFFLIIIQQAQLTPLLCTGLYHLFILFRSKWQMGELKCIASIKIRSFLLLKNTAESSIPEASSACWTLEYSVWDLAFLKTACHTFTLVTAFFLFLTVKVGQGQWVWCPWHEHSFCVTVPWLSYSMEATTSVHMKGNKLCPWLSNYRQTERRGLAREQRRHCLSLGSSFWFPCSNFFYLFFFTWIFTWWLSLCLTFSFPKYLSLVSLQPLCPLSGHLCSFLSFLFSFSFY